MHKASEATTLRPLLCCHALHVCSGGDVGAVAQQLTYHGLVPVFRSETEGWRDGLRDGGRHSPAKCGSAGERCAAGAKLSEPAGEKGVRG